MKCGIIASTTRIHGCSCRQFYVPVGYSGFAERHVRTKSLKFSRGLAGVLASGLAYWRRRRAARRSAATTCQAIGDVNVMFWKRKQIQSCHRSDYLPTSQARLSEETPASHLELFLAKHATVMVIIGNKIHRKQGNKIACLFDVGSPTLEAHEA